MFSPNTQLQYQTFNRKKSIKLTKTLALKNFYLIFECVQGSVSGFIFNTLSEPAMNGPVTQIPAVWTVSKPQISEEKKKIRLSFSNRTLEQHTSVFGCFKNDKK